MKILGMSIDVLISFLLILYISFHLYLCIVQTELSSD